MQGENQDDDGKKDRGDRAIDEVHRRFDAGDREVPVYPTIASRYNDPGTSYMFVELCRRIADKKGNGVLWKVKLHRILVVLCKAT